ncbi:MAG: hypothetical protein R3B81_09260 [bacterium]
MLETFFSILLLCADCAEGGPPHETLLRGIALDDDTVLVEHPALSFDRDTSSDGGGSARIVAAGPGSFPVCEVQNPVPTVARGGFLAFRANLRSEGLDGRARLVAHYPGRDGLTTESRFSRTEIRGDSAWTSHEAPMFTLIGAAPDRITLGVEIEGQGTVWIDEIQIVRVEPVK